MDGRMAFDRPRNPDGMLDLQRPGYTDFGCLYVVSISKILDQHEKCSESQSIFAVCREHRCA